MSDVSRFIDDRTLSERVGISRSALQHWRLIGQGPPFIRIGKKKIIYDWEVVQAWLAANTQKVGG